MCTLHGTQDPLLQKIKLSLWWIRKIILGMTRDNFWFCLTLTFYFQVDEKSFWWKCRDLAKVDPGIGLDNVTYVQTPVVRVPNKREIFTCQVLSQMDSPTI